jgi:rhodanese-related sulfurtransferase
VAARLDPRPGGPAHDHGGAAGAFSVVDGVLVEDRLDPGTWAAGRRTSFKAGSRTWFGPDHAHVLGNRGPGPATSVHAYSPPGLPLRFAPLAVLEWRLDPTSPHRLAQLRGHDQPVVVLCSEGYTSSLAAAALQDLGLHRATDVVGGYHAWARAGLPVQRPGPRR